MVSALASRGHWVHIVVFGIPVLGLVGAVAAQEIRARRGIKRAQSRAIDAQRGWSERLDGRDPNLRVAAVGLLAAAAIHGIVIPEHFREHVLFGLFFAALTAAQLVLAVIVTYRPDRRMVR